MWEKVRKITDIVLTTGFLGFVYLVLIMTYTGPVQKAVEDTKFTFVSYENLSKKFEGILQKNIYEKYEYINLNGLVARMLRFNSLNNRQKLANGYLSYFESVRDDIAPLAQNIIELNEFLKKRNIDFLYVLAPSKASFYDAKFAKGYNSDAVKNIDSMLKILKPADVRVLDMNAWFKENGWHMKDAFFKTDHHWKTEAGLAAARATMELLNKEGIININKKWLEKNSYNVKVIKNCFLGVSGKRTGKFYAGVDDFSLYLPKFATNYTYAILRHKTTNWEYSNAIVNLDYLKNKNYFTSNAYNVYLYNEYPLSVITNTEGCNDKRILVMGDSFRRPWLYFLSTQFKEINAIDLRSYTDGTLVQYIEEIQPDILIMCSNEREFFEKSLYDFGVKEYLAALEKPLGSVQEFGNMELQAEEKNNNKFEIVCSNLEPNQVYTLTIDSAELSGVENSFIQMTLQNLSENKAIYNRYFDANSDRSQKWIFTTPEKVEDTYGIYLYAGTKGHTAKIGVKVDGIRLRKGIFEQ